MKNINTLVYNICKEHFENLLENGAFPEVQYKTDKKNYTTYLLYAYMEVWARFMRLVHDWMRENVDENGIYTRKRNKAMTESLRDFVNGVTEKEISEYPNRFGIMGYD